MNLYFGACPCQGFSEYYGEGLDRVCVLISFAEFLTGGGVDYKVAEKYFNKTLFPHNKLMLDSGAFSVSRSGRTLDLKDYIKFIKYWGEHITHYINLDVIPRKGEDPNIAAQEGFNNWREMRESGLNPIPVYHYGESIDWLHRLIDETDYIGLGGVARMGRISRRQWIHEIFQQYLLDSSGNPKVKVHGFGITALCEMQRIPWASVDSISGMIYSANGRIWIPEMTSKEAHTHPSLLNSRFIMVVVASSTQFGPMAGNQRCLLYKTGAELAYIFWLVHTLFDTPFHIFYLDDPWKPGIDSNQLVEYCQAMFHGNMNGLPMDDPSCKALTMNTDSRYAWNMHLYQKFVEELNDSKGGQ